MRDEQQGKEKETGTAPGDHMAKDITGVNLSPGFSLHTSPYYVNVTYTTVYPQLSSAMWASDDLQHGGIQSFLR